jgi:hypothetical protein
MLGLESRDPRAVLGSLSDEWRARTGLRPRDNSGPSPALLITGAVVIGLGFLAWTYLGPDLKRYLKIHNM